MQKLTKAEEEIMQLFWDKGPSLVSALIDEMPDPGEKRVRNPQGIWEDI